MKINKVSPPLKENLITQQNYIKPDSFTFPLISGMNGIRKNKNLLVKLKMLL